MLQPAFIIIKQAPRQAQISAPAAPENVDGAATSGICCVGAQAELILCQKVWSSAGARFDTEFWIKGAMGLWALPQVSLSTSTASLRKQKLAPRFVEN